MSDYKSTLHLPQTDFPMKADLPKREPEMLSRWKNDGIYARLLEKNHGKPPYLLHDGPPYANGNIHFGHILNKVLKDIVVKYKNLKGFRAPYVPGWDCHGLPIELGAVKELQEKTKSKESTVLERREACRDYARRFIASQAAEFQRLGIFGDWENPYLTLDNEYEAVIAAEFADLYAKGFIFEGRKPVHWCASCKTALAEAEVEYENISSPSIYVRFEVAGGAVPKISGIEKIFLVIWTTTPWTLPSNTGLALGDKIRYVAVKKGREAYLVAESLSSSFAEQTGIPVDEIAGSWTGKELFDAKLVCDHPFMKRQSPVVLSDHVTLETGTGVVHIAPGHGQEDYEVGEKYGLPLICPVDAGGCFEKGSLATAREEEVVTWEGNFVKKANPLIIDFLARTSSLLSDPKLSITHSYPHCWRCKNPILFRATEQWFLSLAHNDLRKKSIRAINSAVRWVPSWGHDRIFGMIENRPDWCLSRQRVWGVPIIIHKCTACRKPFLTNEAATFIVERFKKEGADAWWKSGDALLPAGSRCDCGGTSFEKESSILDVWFDSGVSHAAVLEARPELSSPADLYLEGSDQHRGWFHSSLLTSMATRDRAPYKTVLTHGFVVDGTGRKYSKSAKNYVPPDKILNQMGAEILRLWVAAEDYRNDIRVSDEIIKVLAEIYRKIRNTCRFMLGNLFDFDPAKNRVPFEKRTELDRYALHLLSQVMSRVEKAYEAFEFHTVHHTLNRFFTVELSALYLDILKDRLYCDRADGDLRRSAQSTLYEILVSVLPLMAPILSFTAEEVWRHLPGSKADSVFFAEWPKADPLWNHEDLKARWDRIGQVRDEILKALEMARNEKVIRHPLDACVTLSATGDLLTFLKMYEKDWTQILITSQVRIVEKLTEYRLESTVLSSLKVAVEPAAGAKCERCWNYSVEVGKSAAHPGLCGRCERAVT